MSWEIIPQEIKERGEVVGYETCKHVKGLLFEGADGTKGFAPFKTRKGEVYPVLKVLVCFKGGKEHKLTWSNYQLQPLTCPSPGKFTWTQPSKMKHPTYKVRGREYEDTLSPKVEVEGDKTQWECHAQFEAFLVKRMGQALADEIMGAFAEKIVEVMQPPAKQAA
jgi:hypothetical protein